VNELAKKEEHLKKGSGTDNEETVPTRKDITEPMEEVEQTTKSVDQVAKPEEQKVEVEDTTAEEEEGNKMDVDPVEEEFIVVEGGGEGDPLAQEKAVVSAEKDIESAVEEEKKNDEGDSAGAQTSVDNVVEPSTAPTITLPGNLPPRRNHTNR